MTTDIVLVVCHIKANLSSYSHTPLAKLQDALFIRDTKYFITFLSDVGTSLREYFGSLNNNMDLPMF